MVQTTTGPANAPQSTKAAPKNTAEDRRTEKAIDLDDAEWENLVRAANARSLTPTEAVRLAIRQEYGDAPFTGPTHHSGNVPDA